MGVFGIFKIILVMLLWAVCYPLILAGFAYAPPRCYSRRVRAFLSGAVLVGAGMVLASRDRAADKAREKPREKYA